MNQDQLHSAEGDLGQKKKSPLKLIILILVGVVAGFIVLVVLIGLALFILNWARWSTYPFIPTPRNTIRSKTVPDLILNLIMDASESQEEYGVFSRRQLAGWKEQA